MLIVCATMPIVQEMTVDTQLANIRDTLHSLLSEKEYRAFFNRFDSLENIERNVEGECGSQRPDDDDDCMLRRLREAIDVDLPALIRQLNSGDEHEYDTGKIDEHETEAVDDKTEEVDQPEEAEINAAEYADDQTVPIVEEEPVVPIFVETKKVHIKAATACTDCDTKESKKSQVAHKHEAPKVPAPQHSRSNKASALDLDEVKETVGNLVGACSVCAYTIFCSCHTCTYRSQAHNKSANGAHRATQPAACPTASAPPLLAYRSTRPKSCTNRLYTAYTHLSTTSTTLDIA
jgi:hypothetical protein